MSTFPDVRLRRLRRTPALRKMLDMPVPGPEKFMWPVFIKDGTGVSEPIEAIAAEHLQQLPRTVRALLTPLGGTEARGAAFASYLLFEPEFTQALIALGERDAATQADELSAFLYGVIPGTPATRGADHTGAAQVTQAPVA